MTASARSTPSYKGLRPSSRQASTAARGSSKKRDTQCELVLRRALWRLGLRYRIAVPDLPGRPDIVFRAAKIAIFCDGDFWHGRNLEARVAKLSAGHNAPYWVAKIQRNVARDRAHDETLHRQGWTVLHLWETDILADPEAAAREVFQRVREA